MRRERLIRAQTFADLFLSRVADVPGFRSIGGQFMLNVEVVLVDIAVAFVRGRMLVLTGALT